MRKSFQMKKGIKQSTSSVKISALKFIKSVKPRIRRENRTKPALGGDIALA